MVKHFYPCKLRVFNSFIPPAGPDTELLCNMERNPVEQPISAAAAKQVSNVLEVLHSAEQRASEQKQTKEVEFFQSVIDLVSPDAPAEGFTRNWPLIMDTWRGTFPTVLQELSAFVPGTTVLADNLISIFSSLNWCL